MTPKTSVMAYRRWQKAVLRQKREEHRALAKKNQRLYLLALKLRRIPDECLTPPTEDADQ